MTLDELYTELKSCNACKLRAGCIQVVTATGNTQNPILMIVGEAPGADEDDAGEPFVGKAGETLRHVLRMTKIISKKNTLITNTMHCRPPGNKFPSDDSPNVCVGKWLNKEIEILQPKRMLLLGNTPLKYVAGLKGITQLRGQWITVKNIRSMATYHPSYIMRKDSMGDVATRQDFERDIFEMAKEVQELQNVN
jgi:uracil-DNA glycosylase family 4